MNGIVDATGIEGDHNKRIRTKDYYRISPNSPFSIIVEDSNQVDPIVVRMVYYYNDEQFISNNNNIGLSSVNSTTPSNCTKIRIVLQHTDSNNDISLNELDDVRILLRQPISNSTIVALEKDHKLTAIWQKNS